MDRPKPTRTTPHGFHSQEKLKSSQDKENVEAWKQHVGEVKTTLTTRTVTKTLDTKHLRVAARPRIRSDTALLPVKKKVKVEGNPPKEEKGGSNRLPLTDLQKNVKTVVKPIIKPSVQTNTRILKTVKFTSINEPTAHVETKVEETIASKKIVNTKLGSETNIYYSKYTKTSDYKNLPLAAATNKIPKLKVSDAGTSTSPNQELFETVKQYPVDRKNVTVRKSLTPNLAGVSTADHDSGSEEVFVKSSAHYLLYSDQRHGKTDRLLSPIKPNLYAPASMLIFQGIPEEVRRPAKKKTLIQKLGCSPGNSECYCVDIYNSEYLQDIVYYQLKNDRKHVLKRDFLTHFNRCFSDRAAVINWLIQAQDYLDLSEVVLFATIRLFDLVLGSTTIPMNMYQLVGLVVMWIVTKFEDNVLNFEAAKMLALCNNIYSMKQFLKMEKKLLAFFQFDLKLPDITVYVGFYIKQLNVNKSEILVQCTCYILECFTLSPEFSTSIPSLLAASAVCLVLKILLPQSRIWQKLENSLGYYGVEETEGTMQKMLQQLHRVQDPAYKYRRPYHKYATKDKLQVSLVLLRELIAT